MKLARLIASDIAGVALVIAGFEFSFLHWTIDGPGWLVSRFASIGVYEGDGMFGFLLGIFLAWLWLSTAVWLAIYSIQRMVQRARLRGSGHSPFKVAV